MQKVSNIIKCQQENNIYQCQMQMEVYGVQKNNGDGQFGTKNDSGTSLPTQMLDTDGKKVYYME